MGMRLKCLSFALSIAMNEALDKSLSAAAQRLGSGIPKVPGTTRL